MALIVAMARNRVIGRDNRMPWHLPGELQYFKRVTTGKPIIMGRRTFDSIGRPLPGRTNIVVTRNRDWSAPGVRVAADLEAALRLADAQARADRVDEVMVIGGASLYAEALPRAERLYLTRVDADVDGDTWFPAVDWALWHCRKRETHPAGDDNPYDYTTEVWERNTGNPSG